MGWVNMLCFLGSFNIRIGFNFEILRCRTGHQSTWKSDWQRSFFVGELGKSTSENPTVGIYIIHPSSGLPLKRLDDHLPRGGVYKKNWGNLNQHNGPRVKPCSRNLFPRRNCKRNNVVLSMPKRKTCGCATRPLAIKRLKRLHGAWFGVWVYMITFLVKN